MRDQGHLFAVALAILGIAANGCVTPTTKVLEGKCIVPGAKITSVSSSRALLQRLNVTPSQLQASCGTGNQYVCQRKVFSPDARDGKSSNVECSRLDKISSPCLEVESLDFNTRQAAAAPGVEASALEAGGIYNYTEYTCFHSGLKDGDRYLATGLQADSLDSALKAAFERCSDIANGGT